MSAIFRFLGVSAFIAASLVYLAGIASAAGTPIYKCFDKNLGLLYTDVPCKDGEQLDLRPGDADPASVARLERERDRLDQSVAQRILDERRAALQRDLVYGPRDDVFYGGGGPDYSPDYDSGYGYPLLAYPYYSHPRPKRPHMPPRIVAQAPRFAPNPPFQIPRQ